MHAEKARQAEEEQEKQRVVAVKKLKHEALAALYAAYEAEDVGELPISASLSAMPTQAPPRAALFSLSKSGREARSEKKKPFCIAKKPK